MTIAFWMWLCLYKTRLCCQSADRDGWWVDTELPLPDFPIRHQFSMTKDTCWPCTVYSMWFPKSISMVLFCIIVFWTHRLFLTLVLILFYLTLMKTPQNFFVNILEKNNHIMKRFSCVCYAQTIFFTAFIVYALSPVIYIWVSVNSVNECIQVWTKLLTFRRNFQMHLIRWISEHFVSKLYHIRFCSWWSMGNNPGPCITNVFATRRKNFSQWHRSFQRKLLSHWLKFLRHVAITLVTQGPALDQVMVGIVQLVTH